MKKKNNDTIKLLPIIVFSFVIGGIITLSILRWTPILDQVIGNRNTVITKNGTQVYEGTVQDVLVEEVNPQDDSLVTGRLTNNLLVHFPGNEEMIGNIVKVRLNECKGFYYFGEMVK